MKNKRIEGGSGPADAARSTGVALEMHIGICVGSGRATASSARGSTPPSVPLQKNLGAHPLGLVETHADGDSKSIRQANGLAYLKNLLQ